MGGSSGSKPKTDTKTNQPSGAVPGTSPLMTVQPFIGDSQNMLAQQLAAGGYGQVPDLMSMLSQTYNPMQVLDTRPGAVTTPTTPIPPSGGGGTTGGGKRSKGGKKGGLLGSGY